MKTLATILATSCVTVGFIVGILFNMGIVTINEVKENHTTQTYIDGVLVEDTSYDIVKGFNVNVDVVDGKYIGR